MRPVSRLWSVQGVPWPVCGAHIVLGLERSVEVASPASEREHHRRIGGFGKLEALLDGGDDGWQVWPRIDEPDLRLHRKRVAALLRARGAFAVVFSHHDQRAARNTAGGKVGERAGGIGGTSRVH